MVKPPSWQLPPSPPGLPIIGHLHLVGNVLHISFRDLAAKHSRGGGGLMLLCLGAVPTLVVSSPRAVEEIMRTHDHVFTSRAGSTASDDLMYGSSDIIFSPYGEHWRQTRKLVTTHLFNVRKVHSYCHTRKEEDMFYAGTDTSSLVVELSMAELMRNPQQMAKLQGEVRKHRPEGQEMVEEEDLASMPYLRAVVKETLRLHPPGPVLVPHLSIADCVIDGYYVPSGTRIIVNAWALGRDPTSWEKPEEFLLERFMDGGSTAGVNFKGNHFQFLPFGAGRRICPGLNIAMATVEIMLANLVYCFDWQLPIGMEEKDVDMTEVFGLPVHLKEKLMLVPKLPGGAAPATGRLLH